jgi:hypothetical protein
VLDCALGNQAVFLQHAGGVSIYRHATDIDRRALDNTAVLHATLGGLHEAAFRLITVSILKRKTIAARPLASDMPSLHTRMVFVRLIIR